MLQLKLSLFQKELSKGILRLIDTIWGIGESFHLREKTPGDGCTLLMWGWYLDAALPLFSLVRQSGLKWIFNLTLSILLLAAPFVFCRLRYTSQKRKAILGNQNDEHPGRKLVLIWTFIIGTACIEGLLMLHFGIWTAGTDQ